MAYHVYIGTQGSPLLDIPPERIENGSPEFDFAPKTREKDTLAGKTTTPAGVFDNQQLKFNLFFEYAEDLKELVGDAYNAPVAPATHGNIVWGAGGCVALDNVMVVVHDDCDATDDKDIVLPDAKVAINWNPAINTNEDKKVEVQVFGQPSASGSLRYGTGDLTQESVLNPATGTTVAVAS